MSKPLRPLCAYRLTGENHFYLDLLMPSFGCQCLPLVGTWLMSFHTTVDEPLMG
uniref:Uncharacterized protein n=1 Tax=Picea glauca TaxID=3330 RepID=A0A124GMH9_PICGL|nr:hypothetical protein ABT39_MTgene2293 [Picea glauca]